MNIEEGLAEVQGRITKAAARSGRSEDEITLVVVTKTWPSTVIVAAYDAGIRNFGENRIEELTEKKEQVSEKLMNDDIVWHQIGPLQSRKTKFAADHADVFHALDRLKIANRLSRRLVENGRADTKPLPVFLEINVSGEASKAGIDCSNWESDQGQRDMVLNTASKIAKLPGLIPQGLMTMAPWNVNETVLRKVFQQTRLLSEWLQKQLPDVTWSMLSMGMTDDFEIAIEEGATHVRIGRAIFGERN